MNVAGQPRRLLQLQSGGLNATLNPRELLPGNITFCSG